MTMQPHEKQALRQHREQIEDVAASASALELLLGCMFKMMDPGQVASIFDVAEDVAADNALRSVGKPGVAVRTLARLADLRTAYIGPAAATRPKTEREP